jgi:hypothetical protein
MLEAVKPVLLEKVDIISWQFTNSGRGIYIRRLPCRPYPYHHPINMVLLSIFTGCYDSRSLTS